MMASLPCSKLLPVLLTSVLHCPPSPRAGWWTRVESIHDLSIHYLYVDPKIPYELHVFELLNTFVDGNIFQKIKKKQNRKWKD